MKKHIITTGLICLTLLLVNTCVDLPANPDPIYSTYYDNDFLVQRKLKSLSNNLFELQRKYEQLVKRIDKAEKEISYLEGEKLLQQYDIEKLTKKVGQLESALNPLMIEKRLQDLRQ